MKEGELPEPTYKDVRDNALRIIEQERQLALEANLQHKPVDELMLHIDNQRIYTEFAKRLGLL